MTRLISSIKKPLALAAALLLLACAPLSAHAAPAVDPAAQCALTLNCVYAGAPLEGVNVRVYRAADADANMRFTLTPAFSGSGVKVAGLNDAAQWSRAAAALAKYAEENKLAPEHEGKTGAAGALTFSPLAPGLYLIVTDAYKTKGGTYTAAPSLAALPGLNAAGDAWEYSVSVSLKLEYAAAPSPGVSPRPTYPFYSRLPQTGQLNWPVPALVLAGLALAAVGVWLTRRETHDG